MRAGWVGGGSFHDDEGGVTQAAPLLAARANRLSRLSQRNSRAVRRHITDRLMPLYLFPPPPQGDRVRILHNDVAAARPKNTRILVSHFFQT